MNIRFFRFAQLRSCLCLAPSPQDAQHNSTPGVQCSRTLQPPAGSNLHNNTTAAEGGAQGSGCGWSQRVNMKGLGAAAPCGISDEAVPILRTLIHVLYRGATSTALKPDCAVMHTSVNVPQHGTVSMTLFHVTSASLSYCKPAAAAGPGALSDSPGESRCSEPATAKPLRSFIIDSADMRWVEEGGQRQTERERNPVRRPI